jgi:RimJ/RimL family protein N-acetyltransferase
VDLQQLKQAPTRESALKLDVTLEGGTPIGALLLAGAWALREPELLEQITQWRRRTMRVFLTWFEPTPQRTAAYLRDVVLARPDRAFFFVLDGEGRIVGHMGVAGWSGEAAELDNFVRGVAGGHPQLMREAERTLLDWLSTQGVRRVSARVMSFNWMAQDLHASLGFAVARELALERIETKDGGRHEIVEPGRGNVPYRYLVMELEIPTGRSGPRSAG